MSEFHDMVVKVFDRFEAQFQKELAAAADHRGFLTREACDAIYRRNAARYARVFEELVNRAERVSPEAAQEMREEFAPLIAMLRKGVRDRLWPH